jgi:hypothetical protein
MMLVIKRFLQLALAALREIFDESAYSRFLAREGAVTSREAYQQFLRENETARLKKPRCC